MNKNTNKKMLRETGSRPNIEQDVILTRVPSVSGTPPGDAGGVFVMLQYNAEKPKATFSRYLLSNNDDDK